jgi:hypothetical protein
MVQLFGPEDAGYLLRLTGKLIGMQYFEKVAPALTQRRGGAKEFAAFLGALLEAQDDVIGIRETGGTFEIRQQSWKLMADVADYHPACAKSAGRSVRRPRRRLWPSYFDRHAIAVRRQTALCVVDRMMLAPLPALTRHARARGEGGERVG